MNRHSCSSRSRSRFAGCFWKVRNALSSPCSLDDPQHGVGSQRSHELVLEVGVADEEPQRLEVRPTQVRPQASTLEAVRERAFLACVAEAGELHVESARAESPESVTDRVCAADRHDRDAFGFEVSAATSSERLEGQLIADPLDEDHGVHLSISRNAGLTKP